MTHIFPPAKPAGLCLANVTVGGHLVNGCASGCASSCVSGCISFSCCVSYSSSVGGCVSL